ISSTAEAQPVALPPPEDAAGGNVTDGAGVVAAVVYQRAAEHFDDRRLAAVMGADLLRLSQQFLYARGTVEVGGAIDVEAERFTGFRYHISGLGGIAFGDARRYVAVGAGLGSNGDVRGAVPAALTLPVEIAATGWVADRIRLIGWIRGDHFLAVRESRRTLADDVLLDEMSAGLRFVLDAEQRTSDDGKLLRRGIALGAVLHR